MKNDKKQESHALSSTQIRKMMILKQKSSMKPADYQQWWQNLSQAQLQEMQHMMKEITSVTAKKNLEPQEVVEDAESSSACENVSSKEINDKKANKGKTVSEPRDPTTTEDEIYVEEEHPDASEQLTQSDKESEQVSTTKVPKIVPKKRRMRNDNVIKLKTPEQQQIIYPKNPLNAFMFFRKENHASIRQKNPHLTKVTQVWALVGKIWKNDMNDEEKRPYKLLYEKDKVRFNKQMKDFIEKGYFTQEDGTRSDQPSEIMGKRRQNTKKKTAGTPNVQVSDASKDSQPSVVEHKNATSNKTGPKSHKGVADNSTTTTQLKSNSNVKPNSNSQRISTTNPSSSVNASQGQDQLPQKDTNQVTMDKLDPITILLLQDDKVRESSSAMAQRSLKRQRIDDYCYSSLFE